MLDMRLCNLTSVTTLHAITVHVRRIVFALPHRLPVLAPGMTIITIVICLNKKVYINTLTLFTDQINRTAQHENNDIFIRKIISKYRNVFHQEIIWHVCMHCNFLCNNRACRQDCSCTRHTPSTSCTFYYCHSNLLQNKLLT